MLLKDKLKNLGKSYVNSTIIRMTSFRFVCVHNSWSCLRDYTGMHGQQSIKYRRYIRSELIIHEHRSFRNELP